MRYATRRELRQAVDMVNKGDCHIFDWGTSVNYYVEINNIILRMELWRHKDLDKENVYSWNIEEVPMVGY